MTFDFMPQSSVGTEIFHEARGAQCVWLCTGVSAADRDAGFVPHPEGFRLCGPLSSGADLRDIQDPMLVGQRRQRHELSSQRGSDPAEQATGGGPGFTMEEMELPERGQSSSVFSRGAEQNT